MGDEDAEPVYTTYVTESGQQKVLSLADGSRIRLNEDVTLIVPEKFKANRKKVDLQEGGYFEVKSNKECSFLVKAAGSMGEVLGTKLNVKADSASNYVQVAVLEGKTTLKSGNSESVVSAHLNRNNFGALRLYDNQIMIENVNTENDVSWLKKRLKFSGELLGQVGRQLERLYGVEIIFKSNAIKDLQLTADMGEVDLKEVLTTISNMIFSSE